MLGRRASLNPSSFQAPPESTWSRYVRLAYWSAEFGLGGITSRAPGTMESPPPVLFRKIMKARQLERVSTPYGQGNRVPEGQAVLP